MAEFKLGRIRFVWKDVWAAGTTYVKDDVVRKNGKVYICTVGHTAATDFYVDANNVPARWNQMSDGQTWRSDWTPNTVYYVNDIVKYGGQVYICTIGHTSAATTAIGLEIDLDLGDSTTSKWHIFAESFDWKGDWSPSTRYKRHDIVKYGGNVYLCNFGHTSASTYTYGLEGLGLGSPTFGYWDIYSEAFDWKTDWAPATRYKINDVVRFGGTTYVCNLGHTSAANFSLGLEADQTKWDYFNQGIEYKQDWDYGGINYKINDVVKHAGDLWICTKKHTSNISSTFQMDEAAGRWARFVEGLKFQDSWNSSTIYEPGDIVTYGGYAYVAKTNHSNISPISPITGAINWSLYTTGFTLKNDWDKDTNYKVGEVVRVNGYTYVCISDTTKLTTTATATSQSTGKITISNALATTTATATTALTVLGTTYYYVRVGSLTGLTRNRSIVFTGTAFGSITSGQVYYINDVMSTTAVTISGVQQAGTSVTVTTAYVHGLKAGQTITVAGTSLVDTANVIIDSVPSATTFSFTTSTNTIAFTQTSGTVTPAPQIIITSTYGSNIPTAITTGAGTMTVTAGETYFVGQAIRFSGTTFGNIQTGSTPKQTYWIYSVDDLTNIKISTTQFGSPVSTTAAGTSGTKLLTVTSLTGIGVGFQVSGTGITPGTKVSSISGYVVTLDTNIATNITLSTGAITFTSYFVPQTATGSMTAEVVAEPPNDTFWGRLNSGLRWTNAWVTDIDYFLGDAVRYGPNSYICIQQHHSLTNNRPDNDTTGTYWNILASGSETSVMTTQGDLVYFGGSGPTRLPIGADGQVLVVNGSTVAPQWKYWGTIDQLYYVATGGTDTAAPSYGITVDKPWKTIRYACQQILAGARNPNAAYLLRVNRQFIQRETINWINYQVANNISPFTSGFTYDSTKCERDTGYVIDALVYDLTHGGNVKSRAAALAYVNGTYSLLSAQKAQDVAAFNYAINNVAIAAVLANTAPFQNYQVLNGIASGSRINQVIDTTYTSESTAASEITADLKIITDAITAGVSTGVPAELKPNYTILVKTGIYYETLPIVVPENTAIVGDELRSTNVRPASSLINSGDKTYSLAALAYIKTILNNIVTGGTVTTNQITYAQNKTLPLATSTEGTLAGNLIQNAIDYITFYLNSTGSAPTMTGTNTPASTYNPYAAIRLLELNRNFIIAQTHAYIAATYSSYTYTIATCTRDINEYINALKYDLQYTGNYKTLVAAQLYVNAYTGSVTQNMFYVRNGTGLRNMTVQGLTGTLGTVNSYGTQRPTAGAYVSLDPGYGVNDSDVWITTKSCYVQNVTTFGTGCVGLKIDGNLHSSGNKSVVANDFTQVLSDGIGVWCTNNARTELVSVFSYYGHIGYLAENGGKIRATNGNSSYGAFGTVSEGVDSTEVPVTGLVNNRYFQAQVGLTTNNNTSIQRLEFTNAGNNYANSATYAFNGSGINATAVFDEIRDNAVFESRLLGFTAGNTPLDGQFGGSSYFTAQNVAQAGGLYNITLAATDSQTAGGYQDMRIVTVSGTAPAQQARIINYNAGSKIAIIAKESFVTLTVTAATTGTNLITTSSNITLYANMPIYFSAAVSNLTAYTLYYVVASSITSAGTTFQVSTTPSGSAAAITGSVTGLTVSLYAAGWDPMVIGTTVLAPDPSTLYLIEPRVTFAGPGFTGTATGTLPTTTGNVGYKDGVFSQTRSTNTNLSVTGGSGVGATFNVTRVGLIYSVTQNSTGTSINPSSITGSGTQVTINYATQASAPFTTGQTITLTGVTTTTAYNGTWVVVTSSTTATVVTSTVTGTATVAGATRINTTYVVGDTLTIAGTSVDGTSPQNDITISVTAVTSGLITAFSSSGYGRGGQYFALPVSGSVGAYSKDGVTWTSTAITNQTWGAVATGTISNVDYIVTLPGGGVTVAQYSTNGGQTWTTNGVPTIQTYTAAAFGNSRFVGVASTTNTPVISTNGTSWANASGTLGTPTNWTGIAYGLGVFMAIATGGTTSAYSADGNTWATATLPASGAWASIAYGNGRFVAISTTNNTAAVSINGSTWQTAYIPNGTTWSKIQYAQGLFVIIPSGSSNNVAYSEDGFNWTSTTLGTADTRSRPFFGNANSRPRWIVLPTSSTTTGFYVQAGATAKGRAKVTSGSVSEMRIYEPGSNYPFGNITAVGGSQAISVTSTSGTTITTSTNLTTAGVIANQPIVFTTSSGSIVAGTTYYVLTASGTSMTISSALGGGTFTVGTGTANTGYLQGVIQVDNTTNLVNLQPVNFNNASSAGLVTNQQFYVAPGSITSTSFRVIVAPTAAAISVASTSGTTITTTTNLTTLGVPAGAPITFSSSSGSIVAGTVYYVLTASGTTMTISATLNGSAFTVGTGTTNTGTLSAYPLTARTSGQLTLATYNAGGAITITDPNRVFLAQTQVRAGVGVLANPTFTNRGTLWTTSTTTISGDGFADLFQPGQYISVSNLSGIPTVGSNVVFSTAPTTYYKLVTTTNLLGSGPYTATFQLSPVLAVGAAPAHNTPITIRIKYSQVRLTGHDFLSIGTGNFTNTNYPGIPLISADSNKQTVESGGGRVFFTSTDQDGNFNVGNLFSVQQATGTATLNANAFNLAGLQSLSLGSVNVGGSAGATITEFSTDQYFTANSDSILPTQRAIKAYIASQIGSGSSTLNVNTLTAGSIFVQQNIITTTTGFKIDVGTKLTFIKGIDGYPLALNMFLS